MGESEDIEARQAAGFPTTRWSLLVADPAAGAAAARAAFEALTRRYYPAVEAYARALGERQPEGAREATQEFFLWMLESGFLGRADRARGRFRGFVKASFANFLRDRVRHGRAAKRGGDGRVRSLDEDDARELPDLGAAAPDAALDERWRAELLAQAADALEAELAAKGKGGVFAVFRDYYLGEEELDYAAVAARHGVSKVDVSNHLMLAKRRYRAHLRAAVLETVGTDEDLRAELAWLLEGAAP